MTAPRIENHPLVYDTELNQIPKLDDIGGPDDQADFNWPFLVTDFAIQLRVVVSLFPASPPDSAVPICEAGIVYVSDSTRLNVPQVVEGSGVHGPGTFSSDPPAVSTHFRPTRMVFGRYVGNGGIGDSYDPLPNEDWFDQYPLTGAGYKVTIAKPFSFSNYRASVWDLELFPGTGENYGQPMLFDQTGLGSVADCYAALNGFDPARFPL